MSEKLFILKSFRQFLSYRPGRLLLLFLLTLLQGLTQGVTLVLLVPLLGLLAPNASSDNVPNWIVALQHGLGRLGLEPGLESILVVFAVSMLFVSLLSYAQSVGQATYQQGFSFAIRRRLFQKMITSDWTFLHGKSKHNHIQVLTTEIPKMTTYYFFYVNLASKLLFILSHLILALSIAPGFSLLIVATGLAVFALLRGTLTRSQQLGSANIQAFRQMLKHIDEFWLTVKMAKVHQSEAFYFNKFDQTNARMRHYQNQQIRNRALPQLLFQWAGVLALVTLVLVSVRLLHLPLASLAVLILLFGRIFPRVAGLNTDLNMLLSNVASVQLVLETDRELEARNFVQVDSAERVPLNQNFEIRDLCFGYPSDQPLYHHLDVTINAHCLTGILGESGCGKTTLIDLMAGLLQPQQGRLMVDGEPLKEEQLPVWRHQLGYLPQDPVFIDGTLRDNLIWDSRYPADDEQIMAMLRQVNAEDLVTRHSQGLDTSLANYAYHFSGGERQRLALARVLLRRPTLLLLDEATASLDAANERAIMDCLARLKQQVTIVFVTHNQALLPYFDQVIHLQNPRPVAPSGHDVADLRPHHSAHKNINRLKTIPTRTER